MKRQKNLAGLALGILMLLGFGNPAEAHPNHPNRHNRQGNSTVIVNQVDRQHHRGFVNTRYHYRNGWVRYLPKSTVVVHHHGQPFYYTNGIYYVPERGGFVEIIAPRAVVRKIRNRRARARAVRRSCR